MTAFIQEIFGYPIIAKIGTGAASELYAVQDPKTRQVWALKHVVRKTDKDHRFIEQVESEYSIGSKLKHPNIRGIGKVERKRKLFTVTEIGLLLELVDADSLDGRLPRTMLEAVQQFSQIAQGLAYMHERGFVHADMKPINAMVSDTGHVKIIDLGQACAIGAKKKRIQGTPGYIAPEQAYTEAITGATDVYNLGATMYFVLIGELIPTAVIPRSNGDLETVPRGQIRKPVAPIERNKSIPQALSDLILECVQLDPADRVSSMSLVASRLDLLAATLQGSGNSKLESFVRAAK